MLQSRGFLRDTRLCVVQLQNWKLLLCLGACADNQGQTALRTSGTGGHGSLCVLTVERAPAASCTHRHCRPKAASRHRKCCTWNACCWFCLLKPVLHVKVSTPAGFCAMLQIYLTKIQLPTKRVRQWGEEPVPLCTIPPAVFTLILSQDTVRNQHERIFKLPLLT